MFRSFISILCLLAAGPWIFAQERILNYPESIDLPMRTHAIPSSVESGSGNPLLNDYDVKFYKLDVEVSDESDYIEGSATILVQVQNNPLSTFVIELFNSLTVDEVLINGEKRPFNHIENEVQIELGTSIATGAFLTAQLFYHGPTGEGMVSEIDSNWDIPVTYTLSEPFYARDWFPCKQDLTDKADSVHLFVTTDYGLRVASNGILTGTTYFPNGKVRHEWKSNYPIAFYLISISVADYTEYNIYASPPGLKNPVFIQNYLYDIPGIVESFMDQINMTIPMMELFSDLFGDYPFRDEKYGHYMWPWGGGMENQTMTGMGSFDFLLVAHELGHSWFGNYVTCETWQDIWINEGFATYASYLALENLAPDFTDGYREYRFERALREPDGRVYIPAVEATSESRIFNSNLSYSKGMVLIHMIRFELQDDALFFSTLKNFISRYANDVATGMDFKDVLEETSGMDFTDFFDQWYVGAGYPIYDLNWSQTGDLVTLQSTQTTSSEQTPLFKMSMEYRLFYPGGDSTIRLFQSANQETYDIPFPHVVDSIRIDPDNWVLDGENSSVKKVITDPDGSGLFSLFPNPNNGLFSIHLAEVNGGEVTLEVFNVMGQLKQVKTYPDNLLPSPIEINIVEESSGIYILRLKQGNRMETKKIIVE